MTKRIPIYDASAPITCTIGSDEIPDRIEVIERMRLNLDRIERTDHGLLLQFPDRPEIDADVRRFAVDEKRCCQFWGFAVRASSTGLVLQWDGPPDADELLDRLHAYFEGDAPLTAITGLL
jgi:hypothetical protein